MMLKIEIEDWAMQSAKILEVKGTGSGGYGTPHLQKFWRLRVLEVEGTGPSTSKNFGG